ncbi:hypothetical protein AB4874_16710 [Thioclava sp. 15-R06ZXC-3]|uniref:Uncharacterized protein n=1 Tax=Thioclava arctica TaxID=3238301 RepID=A0ABV3TNQ9_9RHOB
MDFVTQQTRGQAKKPMKPVIPLVRVVLSGARACHKTRDIQRIEDMKKSEKPSKASASSAKTDSVDKLAAKKPPQDVSPSANDLGQGVDRPGFDMGGSSGDTHAGSGLGLGNDAFDTPGDRRLPGRRLDGKLTIPRWGGPEPRDTTASDAKTADAESSSTPQTKKAR